MAYRIISEEELEPGLFLPVVRFPGIAHVIVKEDKMDPAAAKAVIPRWCRQLKTDALGILLTNQDLNRIRPLVYVRQTDSGVWERGCGSGTAAIALRLLQNNTRALLGIGKDTLDDLVKSCHHFRPIRPWQTAPKVWRSAPRK